MNDKNTIAHTDAYNTQFWAHCAPSVDAHVSTHRTCGSRLPRVCHPCHPCMRTCVWCLQLSVFFFVSFVFYLVSPFSFQTFLMSTSALNERSMSNLLCYSSLGSVVTSDYVTPSQVMSPRRTWTSWTLKSWTSLPPAMSISSTTWTTLLPSPTIPTSTTTSLRNSLQLWSIEQGNLLRWEAIMINFLVTSETWKVFKISFLFSHSTQKNDQSNWRVCSRKDRWGAWKL